MMLADLTKVECLKDGVIYEENGNLGNLICLPNGFSGEVKITLDETYKIPLDVIERVLNDDSKNQYKTYPFLSDLKEILNNDIDNLIRHEFSFPKLNTYKDVTDLEFNNFSKIEKTTIVSDGLWVGNGIRKIELEFDEEFSKFISNARKKEENEDKKIDIKLIINQKNNDEIEDELEFKIIKKDNYQILLDTDKFIEFFENTEKIHSFYGYIEISIRKEEMPGLRDKYVNYTFKFPFEVKMKNPLYSGAHQSTQKVGIDFGTSSTCISKNMGSELVAFTDNPEGLADYENMTALVIYNWKKIYQVWKHENKTLPHMNRNKHFKKIDDIDLKEDHFDYGKNVKDELEIDPSPKTLEAVISNIKSIPGKLQDDSDNKETFIPFDKDSFKKQVSLTDTVDDEDEETLNPIALYGYLIGRALNLQIKDEIYTNYTITMPVKFNTYQRNKILESLEYGLRRALPHTLKDELSIQNDYEESVALLGAAKKMKELRIKKSDELKAIPFAVFDFGGGTLDFAFGIYRKSDDDNAVFEEEEETYSDVIEIFKTDGVKIGGETLINSIAYKLYVDNQDEMKKNEIPIIIPDNEEKLKDYPQGLFAKSHVAKVNLQTLSEKIARKIFINPEEDIDNVSVELFSINDANIPEEIIIKINKDNIMEFLQDTMNDLVINFKRIIENVFKDNMEILTKFGLTGFNLNDIKIFQAGNTCKSVILQDVFDEIFENHEKLVFIEDEKREITPKNAVAKGSLMLEGTGVYNHSIVSINGLELMPIDRYIWNIEDVIEDEDEAKAQIKSGDNSNLEWKRISRISNGSFTIYYSFSSSVEDDEDDSLLHHTIKLPAEFDGESRKNIWAKPYDGKRIECIIGDKKGDDLNEYTTMIIDLDSGSIDIKNEEG